MPGPTARASELTSQVGVWGLGSMGFTAHGFVGLLKVYRV